MINFQPFASGISKIWSLQIHYGENKTLPIEYSYSNLINEKQNYFLFSKKIEEGLQTLFHSEGNFGLIQNFSDNKINRHNLLEQIFISDSDEENWLVDKNDIDACMQIAAVFRAIFTFLHTNDRVVTLDARNLFVYSLWQWYGFLKILTALGSEDFYNEFAYAFKIITDCLDNLEYETAFTFILRLNPKKSGIHEFLVYSLVLELLPEQSKAQINYRKPLPPTGVYQGKSFDWSSVILHPIFLSHRPATVAIIRLITHYALPSYDFDASFNLAHLLLNNKPLRRKNIVWMFIANLAAFIFIPLFLINTIKPLDYPFPIFDNIQTSLAVAVTFIGFVWTIVYFRITFSKELIIHLFLPRVWAGILVGYSSLIFESSTVNITCALWKTKFLGINQFGIYFLWAVSLIVSTIYIYYDILPWALNKTETKSRTFQTLCFTLLLSILLGLVVIPLSTVAYNNPDEFCSQYLLNNIFGAIDFKQLIVFVPLAYITGLISQFIFEEKPLTTSVWAPIRE